MVRLELLAPAKNLQCGIAAIDHGADAVYIGAPRFGARAAASNTVDDIRQLCAYAHRFLAKVYVTLNTIVYDDELDDLRRLAVTLSEAGADAFLIQDMGLLTACRQWLEDAGLHTALHASTQTDNRSPKKVAWLAGQGCSRVVLARELPLQDMARIHQDVPHVELEAFVHGALCVSYSGVCYASQHCFGRSANRGACAQFCRLEFSLVDADNRQVAPPRHWLSLKDMCRLDYLEQMAQAGITSFKIEGRLKDVSYVKNVVAAYNRQLDKVVAEHPDLYRRASLGRVALSFTPDVARSFNRGFTPYFINGERTDIAAIGSPKAIGAKVGRVTGMFRGGIKVVTDTPLVNGDGLCFFGSDGRLEGFRVNRVDGNRIYPQHMPEAVAPGMTLYRNYDQQFERILDRPSAVRRIPVRMTLEATEKGCRLSMSVCDTDLTGEAVLVLPLQPAEKPQRDTQKQLLARLGQTAYEAVDVVVDEIVARSFLPSSQLAALRREAVADLDACILRESGRRQTSAPQPRDSGLTAQQIQDTEYAQWPYLYNISNHLAREFYRREGLTVQQPAFELDGGKPGSLLMQCRHCIRYTLGACERWAVSKPPSNSKSTSKSKLKTKPEWKEPLYLQLPDGRRFRLRFLCNQCLMQVYAEE